MFPHLLHDFLLYLEVERGRNVKTVENYRRYLERFVSFARLASPADITEDAVRAWRLHLNRRELNRRTQNYHLIALRGFLKYLVRRGVSSLAAEQVELARTPQRDIGLIESDDVERLLHAPEGAGLQAARDRAVLELLFSTGLRVSELCALDRDDIPKDRDELSIRGKGGNIRVAFLSPTARAAVRAYINLRADISAALFVRTSGKEPTRLTPRSIQRLIKRYAVKAGISKKVTPHTLRHAFATDLLINGADMRSVQAMLGHVNIATTQVYTHVTDRQLREVHQAFHARRRKKQQKT